MGKIESIQCDVGRTACFILGMTCKAQDLAKVSKQLKMAFLGAWSGPYQRLVILARVITAKTAIAGHAEGSLRVVVLEI